MNTAPRDIIKCIYIPIYIIQSIENRDNDIVHSMTNAKGLGMKHTPHKRDQRSVFLRININHSFDKTMIDER